MPRSFRAIVRNPLSRIRSFEERLGIIAFSLMLLFAMSHGLLAHEFKAGDITIAHPWSRETPAGAKVAAGYLTLTNTGATADRLVAVSSEIAGRAEIHEMSVDGNGVMTMRPLKDGVEIPAGGTVELKPGAIHIMFMELNRAAKKGETFAATLTFEKAGSVDVQFAVDAMAGGMEGMDHGG